MWRELRREAAHPLNLTPHAVDASRTDATGQKQVVVVGASIAYLVLHKEDAAQAVVAARARRGPARSRDASPNHEPACRTMLVSRVVSRNV